MAAEGSRGTVPARLAERARERPKDVALEVIGAGSLTLGEWQRRSDAVARALDGLGVRRGDRMILPCESRDWLDYAVAYVAVQKVGATAIPVLRRLGDAHLEWVWERSGAVGAVGDLGTARVRTWSWTVAALEAGRSRRRFANKAREDDAAEIIYTSGTTGVPKGVLATHASVLFTHSHAGGGGGKRIVLHANPPGSLAGQGAMLQALDGVDHEVLTLPVYDDDVFVSAIVDRRVTHVVLVPALALSLIRAFGPGEVDLSSVQLVRTMSAPMPPAALGTLAVLFGEAAVENLYTTTEAWPARVRMRFNRKRPDSVGRPVGSGQLRIVDDVGFELPAGGRGNIELRWPGAPQRRYVDDDEATRSVFLEGGWVRTGDIGYVDEEGYLFLVDRRKDLVNVGGHKVSTSEVEAALLEFPGVLEAAVVGLPGDLGEEVTAAVRADDRFDHAGLMSFLRGRLGPVKAPRRVVVVDQLPRNAMGKVRKTVLREQLTAKHDGGGKAASTGDLYETVRRIVATARGEEFVPVDVPVEQLVTSLGAMSIVAHVRSELGRKLTLDDVSDAVDLADLVRRVEAAAPADTSRPRIRRVEGMREGRPE